MSIESIKKKIRDVKDFPQKGIIFRDLTTVFKDRDCLHALSEELTKLYKEKGITKCCRDRIQRIHNGARLSPTI